VDGPERGRPPVDAHETERLRARTAPTVPLVPPVASVPPTADEPPPPVGPSRAPARPARRWPWVLALLLAVAAAGVAFAVAVEQRDVAAAWRDRALALEEQRDAAVDQNATLQGQLDDIAALLTTSETDVSQLETRLRELADEKAQAEDTATTVQVERDVFLDLTARIADATDALDVCVSRLFDLQQASVDAFNRSAAGESVDVAPLNAQATDVTSFCNDARQAAASASAAADQLTRP
jgi:hypothetical protein